MYSLSFSWLELLYAEFSLAALKCLKDGGLSLVGQGGAVEEPAGSLWIPSTFDRRYGLLKCLVRCPENTVASE